MEISNRGKMSVNHKKVTSYVDFGALAITYDCGVIYVDTGGKITLRSSSIRPYEMKRWAHDEICYYLFGGEGKVSLQSITGFLSDASGLSTPDQVVVAERKVTICEVKTSLSKSSSAYTAATRQYLHVLRSAVWDYDYLCLGASPSSVTWDEGLSLKDQDLEHIVAVMKLSKKIQDKLLEEGVMLDDYTLSNTTLSIPTVSLTKENNLAIDDELINYWRSLNVGSVSGSMIMLESAKQVPDIQSIRSDDEKTLRSLYKDGIVSGEMPFKIGMMVPSVDTTVERETRGDTGNDKLQFLWRTYDEKLRSGGDRSCKINLKGYELSQFTKDDMDVRKGLWAGLLSGKSQGIFRDNGGVEKRAPGPVHFPMKPLEPKLRNMGKRYAPMELDLGSISSTLCSHTNIVLPEGKQTLVNRTTVELPFQNEYWFQATKFWQRLIEEVNVGRYSSQGKWNSFHCHQICPYNAWVFVHGTGLHSHQFYYLVFHTTDPVCWSNDLIEFSPGWWCTHSIKSLRSDKINQHLNILERLVSLRYYWNSVLGAGIRARKHFAASLLIAYDSKQQTIDTLSLFRYVYMEFCKSAETRNPAKVVSKFPHEIRSPVLAWVIYQMRKLVLCTSQLQPALKKTKQNTSRMNFKGLVSWVDFEPIKNFNVILSLSYMQYATSHPVSIGLHGKIQIMGKLIKEEKRLDFRCHDYCQGNNSTASLGPHEYSSSFVKKIAQNASQRLTFVYPSYESFIRVYSHRLFKWHLSDFATFKKSTMVSDPDPGKRAYCFEEVLRLTDHLKLNPLNASNYSPYIELTKLIRYQEEEIKNKNVSIFVKDQQSGLREIFVLPINLRILIKSMEIFARLVNETFPNETLSYPKRKDLVVTEHIRKAQVQTMALKKQIQTKSERVILLRYSSSSDAKAWCQQFCMPVFGCFITSLLHESYGEESTDLIRYFCFILNQITGKHIHVDQRVKEWLRTTKGLVTGVDYLADLLDMYQGIKEGLYEDGSIVNMSNMMQGIPHETSSSLHASYLLFMTMILKSLIIEQITKKLKLIKLGVPVIDSLVSSDDSGILFSLPVLVEEEDGHLKKGHEVELGELKKLLYKLGYSIEMNKKMFSAEASVEKSTIFAESPVFEFNSRFYIGRSVATAEIKFAVSSLTLGFHTGIVDRISEALSSLKGCVKEGLRQDQLMILQQCLRRMHVRFLYTDWWDEDLHLKLDTSQSPRLGVLPLVRQGMIGFLNLTAISDYARLLESPSYWPIRRSVQHLLDGTEGYSLMLRVGRKYQQVLKSLNISKEAIISEMKALEICPMRFLKRELPETLLIKIKLLSPGARVALSYVDLAKIHMASCYASTTNCITFGQDKVSLLDCLHLEDLCKGREYLPPVTGLTPELAYLEEVLNNGYLDYVEKDRTKISTEIIFKSEGQDTFGLLTRCWETGFSATEKEALSAIQVLVPNIKDTIEETIKNFDSVFVLESYMRSLSQRGLSVNVLSYSSGSKNFLYSYQTYLRSNWSREHSFVIHGPAINRVKIDIFYKTEIIRWFGDLEDKLSMLTGGLKHPPLDRILISEIQKQVADNTIAIESLDKDLNNILIYLGSKNKMQRIDLTTFHSQKRRILGYKPNLIYIFDRGCWYILTKEDGEWVLLKGEQSPRLPYIECRYVVRDNLPIWVSPHDLRLKVDKADGLAVFSNYWNSECFKDLKTSFPHLRTDNAWVEMRPGPFSFEPYLDTLPKEYRTETCDRLLSAALLDSDRSCGDFDFWVMVSDIISGSEFTKEEKSLARSIMSIATEEEVKEDKAYDPFEEVMAEDFDPEENAEIARFMVEELLGWANDGGFDSESEGDFGGLTLAQDFGDWCVDDLVESYEERGHRPSNSTFMFHWRYRIRSGYSRSLVMHAHRNRHNKDRHERIISAKGKMVFLNPERFGEAFPD